MPRRSYRDNNKETSDEFSFLERTSYPARVSMHRKISYAGYTSSEIIEENGIYTASVVFQGKTYYFSATSIKKMGRELRDLLEDLAFKLEDGK